LDKINNMKNKEFLFILFFLCCNQVIAQNPDDTKIEKTLYAYTQNIQSHPNLFFLTNKKHLPLLYFEKDSMQIRIRDTFYLINNSASTLRLKTLNIGTVVIKDSIQPFTIMPVYFKMDYYMQHDDFYEPVFKKEHTIVIQYDSTQSVQAFLQFDIVNKTAKKSITKDGTTAFLYKQKNSDLYTVQTTKNGYLKSFGRITLNDSVPIGIWKIMDSASGKYLDKQFAKLFIMKIPNEVPMHACIVKIKQTDSSEIVFKPKQSQYIPITITEKTTQVDILYDSAIASYPINFNEQLQEEYMFMQLLKPTDQYFYYGKQKLLFNFDATRYHIKYTLGEKDSAKEVVYLDNLQKKFSRLHIYKKGRNLAFNIIDLFPYTTTEREEILQYILADKNLNYLTRVSDQYPSFYIDNNFTFYSPRGQVTDALYDSTQKLGFISDTYYNNHLRFVYQNKILDEKFIQQYNKLVLLFNYHRFSFRIPRQPIIEQ
jgi:hypothetical protein